MDDEDAPVRAFYRAFKMNYPVAMGNAPLAGRYGGILGLPVAFLIDRGGRVHRRLDGQVAAGVLEKEVGALLAK